MEGSKQPIACLHWGDDQLLLYPGQLVRLGRASENDIVLNDPKISRNHAQLEWNGTGFTLRDLNSINGTYVNHQKLSTAARLLRDGDEISLSRQRIRYEIVRAEQLQPLENAPVIQKTEQLPSRGPYLVVSGGPDESQEYPLWGEMITIGRASREATWEIRLTDRSVSRPHARLEHREDGIYLVDLESVNGTLLNNEQVQKPTLLKDGDVIAIGETHLTFHQ